MKIFSQWRMRIILLGALVLAASLLASCDANSVTGTSSGPYATDGGKGCMNVGILLPDTTSSVRWETKDHPLLVQAVTAAIPGVHIDYDNAGGDSNKQLSQAEADLAKGDCLLIVGAHDSVAAGAIVDKAKLQNVPVIAYDRMIESKNLSYYVSFNNEKVGELQGQYIADHYQDYATTNTNGTTGTDGTTGKNGYGTGPANTPSPVDILMLNGSQTDSNALLFSMGMHNILDPLLASGKLQKEGEIFTPNWDNNAAQVEAEAALADPKYHIQVVYVANDGMAGGVINALKAIGMDGKVLVTGQDATTDGIHAILAGEQNMTVYKPIAQEAASTGQLVKAIFNGDDVNLLINGINTVTFDGGSVPSILDQPILVDSHNIVSTVIADKYLTKQDVCNNIPAGTDGVC